MSDITEPKALFSLGSLMATPGALKALEAHGKNAFSLLMRHVHGDWGTVGAEDAKENELSLKYDFRIMSVYRLDESKSTDRDNCVWIITEADRSSTTILLPDDY